VARKVSPVLLVLALVSAVVPAGAASQHVLIVGSTYQPGTTTVAQGGTVRFVNADLALLLTPHTASYPLGCEDDCVWTTPTLDETQPFADVTIDLAPGEYIYYCKVHGPGMTGTVVVG
jgi:plastocyanin